MVYGYLENCRIQFGRFILLVSVYNNHRTRDHNTPVTHAALLEMWPRHVFLSFYSHNSTASCLYGAETASLMCCRVPGAFFQVLSCSLSFPLMSACSPEAVVKQ